MNTRLDLSFGDPDADVYGYARAGAGAFVYTNANVTQFDEATLQDDTLSSTDALGLGLHPLGPPAVFGDGSSHQPVSVTGTALGATLSCNGTLVATPDPGEARIVRDLAAWHPHDANFGLRARRNRKKDTPADEQLEALALRGEETAWTVFSDPRLTSTYGPSGELLRAGLELWENDESTFAERLGAEVICAVTFGASQVALCRWHYNETLGAGHYVLDARD